MAKAKKNTAPNTDGMGTRLKADGTPDKRFLVKPRKLNEANVRALAEKGVDPTSISKIEGVAPVTIYRYLAKHDLNNNTLKHFKDNTSEYLASFVAMGLDKQFMVMESIGDIEVSALKTTQKGQLLDSLGRVTGIAYDKWRGQTASGGNTVLINIVQGIEKELNTTNKAHNTTLEAEVVEIKE